MNKKIIFALSTALFLFVIHSPIPLPAQENISEGLIDIGTHSLYLKTMGRGTPAVVLDVGLGGSYQEWLPLLRQVSRKTRIAAYDRAGYGRSDSGPFPRDCVRVADELKKLLDTAEIQGPYILVGHSLGGLNMQAFALKYPDSTAGLVLLDPPPLDWVLGKAFPLLKEIYLREAGMLRDMAGTAATSENQDEKRQAAFLRTLASEHEKLLSGPPLIKKIYQTRSCGNIPLTIIASGKPNPRFGEDAEAFQKFWNEQCRALASKSSRGRYFFAPESGHNILRDNPDLVLEVLEKMLSTTTQKNPPKNRF
ncbi:MAG: alpha/beta hydrolase [Candidatus Aminicenantes bacterium]|nr:alpha/beta hydrolase [Candidatus Aminicenantes bacterium]